MSSMKKYFEMQTYRDMMNGKDMKFLTPKPSYQRGMECKYTNENECINDKNCELAGPPNEFGMLGCKKRAFADIYEYGSGATGATGGGKHRRHSVKKHSVKKHSVRKHYALNPKKHSKKHSSHKKSSHKKRSHKSHSRR